MDHTDVIVVGAGPVGCVTALSLARKGRRVTLLESRFDETPRTLGGEFLHPLAVRVLQELGIDGSRPSTGAAALSVHGFAVYHQPDSDPCLLPYPAGAAGWTWEQQALLSALRNAVERCPGITLLRGRAVALSGQRLTCRLHGDSAGETTLTADLIVGADGRASVVRQSLGLPDDRRLLSYMAGISLEGVELPHEGWGQIVMHACPPFVLFRIGPDTVRLAVGVDLNRITELKHPRKLAEYLTPVLPGSCREALRRATEQGRMLWATCQYRPRTSHGRPGVALVGDAVGFSHPLTASGLSLGFGDARALAESDSLENYQRTRRQQTRVSERAAISFYQLAVSQDFGARVIKAAADRCWRTSERERQCVLRLLACEETRWTALWKLAVSSVWNSRGEFSLSARSAPWLSIPGRILNLLGWLGRLAGGISPDPELLRPLPERMSAETAGHPAELECPAEAKDQ